MTRLEVMSAEIQIKVIFWIFIDLFQTAIKCTRDGRVRETEAGESKLKPTVTTLYCSVYEDYIYFQ